MDINLQELSLEYANVNESIGRIDALAKTKKAPLTARLQEIEDAIHAYLKDNDIKAVDVVGGKWSRKHSEKFGITNKDEFFEFLVQRQAEHGDAPEFIGATVIQNKAKELRDSELLPSFISVWATEKAAFTKSKK